MLFKWCQAVVWHSVDALSLYIEYFFLLVIYLVTLFYHFFLTLSILKTVSTVSFF